MIRITLTTRGRFTGRSRPVTLYAFPDGECLVIVGSRGGSARDPAWVGNLRANPEATVSKGRQTWTVRAREVSGAERDRLWALVCTAFPLYATYQQRTARVIPLFVLEVVGAKGFEPSTS